MPAEIGEAKSTSGNTGSKGSNEIDKEVPE